MAEFFSRANDLLIEEDFQGALENYNKAIAKEPTKADYFVRRAICHIKLENYTDSVQDANKALEIEPNNSQALFRRGIALFELEEFESAKKSFLAGSKLSPENKNFRTWIRKCNVELEGEEEEEEEQPKTSTEPKIEKKEEKKVEKKEDYTEEAKPQAIKSIIPPGAQDDPLPPSARPKIRHEWYQTKDEVVVTVFAKNVKKEQAQIAFTPDSLSISINLEEGKEFSLDLDLCDKIVPDRCKVIYLSTKLEIKMAKQKEAKWTDLERSNKEFATLSWDDSSNVDKNLYPSSSKIKKNWDAMAREVEEEKLEGDAALNKVFQDIYAKGSEEQKRAMMKSFIESGGTVLSTNWKDVGKRHVEGSPPKGMEMHNWNELTK